MIHRSRILRILSATALLVAAGGIFAPAGAKVAALPLDELIREADFIGVVHIDRTSWYVPFVRDRVATATVIETWAGRPRPSVEFIASPTWICDISDARRGETAVVLLRHRNKPGPMEIVHSGRGRLPIEDDHGEPWVIYWTDVILPAA